MKSRARHIPYQGQAGSARANAFTLVELLTVVAAISILAGFSLLVLRSVFLQRDLNVARVELGQIAAALEDYHSHYHAYPPCNPGDPALNPLYYELTGVTNAAGNYQTLDRAASVTVSNYINIFNVSGALNCAIPTGSGESSRARSFLPGLKQNRIGAYGPCSILITSVEGPDPDYRPLGAGGVNPFCYQCPGVNNPGTYDLWVEVVIGGKTNQVGNW